MKFLLDTHLLIWAGGNPERLSREALALISDGENELFFSVVSFWEISIKRALGRTDVHAAPRQLRRELLANGYQELQVTSEHAFEVESLPLLHRDPFDRILIAQAMVEGCTLLTKDEMVAQYAGPVRRV